jgi:hypothetical protein
MGWLFVHVPGAGLLRDGTRLLSLCALGLAAVAGYGAAALLRRMPAAARPGTVLALVLVPLALMPDAAFGVSRHLAAVDFPSDYNAARAAVEQAHDAGAAGDVLVLPLSSYRQPAWNREHKVLDPLGRYLPLDYVAGDDLFVDGVRVAGEDRRVRQVASALRSSPQDRAGRLARLGIGFVVTEKDAEPSPKVVARTLLDRPTLSIQEIDRPFVHTVSWAWIVAMACAWSLFLIPPAVAVLAAVRRRSRGAARK